MKKFFIFQLFSLIFIIGLSSSEAASQVFTPNTNSTDISVDYNEQDELVLDKDELCIACEPGFRPNEDSVCDINMLIAVSAGDPDDKNLSYKYTISGGRIIGEGAKVSWDLTGAQPGTYDISVDIQNKFNSFKKKKSKTIEVFSQTCGGLCNCPMLSVNAPKLPVKAGETMTFSANVGGAGESVTYDWTVSDGKIIKGQGTPVIRVAINSKMAGQTIIATVEIGGVCEECQRTESASVSIIKTKKAKK